MPGRSRLPPWVVTESESVEQTWDTERQDSRELVEGLLNKARGTGVGEASIWYWVEEGGSSTLGTCKGSAQYYYDALQNVVIFFTLEL